MTMTMTTITIYRINDAGLAFLAAELNQRHKQFSADPLDLASSTCRGMLFAWAAEAECRMDAGESPAVEITSFDSVSGHTEEVRLDVTKHFTSEQQAIEE